MATLQWEYPAPFTIELTVTEDLVDGYGHVSNVHYIQWLTDCAWAHSAAVGLPEQACIELQRGMAVREIHVQMLASAYAGDRIIVGNWITAVDGKLRATRQYQILNAETGATLLRGHVDFVCLNLANGKPARMPDSFRHSYVLADCFKPESAGVDAAAP